MPHPFVAVTLALACLGAAACAQPAQRSAAVMAEFKRLHPCPATGAPRGACPGYEVDHVQPLCAGGPDAVDNLQWLAIDAHRDKTRRDMAACRGRVYKPPTSGKPVGL